MEQTTHIALAEPTWQQKLEVVLERGTPLMRKVLTMSVEVYYEYVVAPPQQPESEETDD